MSIPSNIQQLNTLNPVFGAQPSQPYAGQVWITNNGIMSYFDGSQWNQIPVSFGMQPLNPVSGQMWIDQQNNVNYYDGTNWNFVATMAQITNRTLPAILGQAVVTSATTANEAVNFNQTLVSNRKIVFTANGTWTVPAGVSTIYVSGCAGGGGGGAAGGSVSGGNGGSAGQCILYSLINVISSHILSISIGSAGLGGAYGGNNIGISGGNTTLADTNTSTTLLTLLGGPGGTAGGIAQTTIAVNPSNSLISGCNPGMSGMTVNSWNWSGCGASCIFGTGGFSDVGGGKPVPSIGFGAGGQGGSNEQGQNGAPGLLIIEY